MLKPLNTYQRNRRHNHLHMYLWQILPNCCILLEYNMFHSYRLRYLYMHRSRFEKNMASYFRKMNITIILTGNFTTLKNDSSANIFIFFILQFHPLKYVYLRFSTSFIVPLENCNKIDINNPEVK